MVEALSISELTSVVFQDKGRSTEDAKIPTDKIGIERARVELRYSFGFSDSQAQMICNFVEQDADWICESESSGSEEGNVFLRTRFKEKLEVFTDLLTPESTPEAERLKLTMQPA